MGGMRGGPRPERAAPYERSCRILYDRAKQGPGVVKRARAAIPAAMEQMLGGTCTACHGGNGERCVRDEADAAERARAIREAGEAVYRMHPKVHRPGKPRRQPREREPVTPQRNPFAPPPEKQRELLRSILGGPRDDYWRPWYR